MLPPVETPASDIAPFPPSSPDTPPPFLHSYHSTSNLSVSRDCSCCIRIGPRRTHIIPHIFPPQKESRVMDCYGVIRK